MYAAAPFSAPDLFRRLRAGLCRRRRRGPHFREGAGGGGPRDFPEPARTRASSAPDEGKGWGEGQPPKGCQEFAHVPGFARTDRLPLCLLAAWREKRAMADAYFRVQGVTPSHDDNRYLFTPTQRSMFK